jgi:uncharacterized membrane protein YeaQ/YmgE (transglycosylase-associated protein family)
MTLFTLVVLLIVAGVCGAIGQSIVGYSHAGCFGSIAVGFVGALLGAWVARLLALPEIFELNIGGQHFPVLWSIVGSAIFVAILSLLSGGRRWRYRSV